MNVLVWQWGRRGAGPRFAACLADALRDRPGLSVSLSLCRDAEIMRGPDPPACEMPVVTYRGMVSLLMRVATAPLALPSLVRRVRALRPDLAICAMPGPLDLLMVAALRLVGSRVAVIVHEADRHTGDGFPFQMLLQRLLCRMSDRLAVLTGHVGDSLRRQGLCGSDSSRLVPFTHPPFAFEMPDTARAPGPPRLLCFGRLLPYKGLDLLAAALDGASGAFEVRVAGLGPEGSALAALRACPNVTVENRWIPETEIGALLAWSDAVILPYREASQSGVAAAALAAGRPVIATRVGGLGEQLAGARDVYLCEPDVASLRKSIETWVAAPPLGTRCLPFPVVVGEGPRSTTCSADPDMGVDGGPSPIMTIATDAAPMTAPFGAPFAARAHGTQTREAKARKDYVRDAWRDASWALIKALQPITTVADPRSGGAPDHALTNATPLHASR